MKLENFNKNVIFIILSIFLFASFSSFGFAADTLKIYSPSYFGEQANVYDLIHYLENEDLSFKFCTDKTAKDIRFELHCGSKIENLDVGEFSDSCYFSNFDLESLSCNEFELKILYNLDNKDKTMTRLFKKQRESKLANHILTKDSNNLNPKDLSFFLLLLNDIKSKDNYENEEIYENLKNLRNNAEKCWPASSCSITDTISILNNLKISGYALNSRLLEDGRFYLEKQIIDNAKGELAEKNDISYEMEIAIEYNFSNNEEIMCELELDDEDEKKYYYDDDSDWEDLFLRKSFDDEIIFTCDETIDKFSLKIFQSKLLEKHYTNEDVFSYTLSSYQKSNYDEFTYFINLNHSFSSNEEIECDITIDGSKETILFDEDSDYEDLFLTDVFSESIKFDCEDNFDDVYFEIYSDLEDEVEYENKKSFDYTVGSSSSSISYEFRYDLEYDFSRDEELVCVLDTDSRYSKTYTFDYDDREKLYISGRKASEKISLKCDKEIKNLRFRLFDLYNRAQIDEERVNIKLHSYTIPKDFSTYVCIGENDVCNYQYSVDALSIYKNEFKDSSNLDKYVSSLIQKDDAKNIYISDKDKFVDTGKYLIYKKNDDLVDYLKYSQNNEGSWGTGDSKIYTSSWAILGLNAVNPNNEYVDDGKKWIYFNEPISGWGSIEKNALAYIAIKEKLKPYLKINAENSVSNTTVFKIENPTIYNIREVKVTFDKTIANYISTRENLGDLDSEKFLEFNVSVNSNLLGKIGGEMIIEGIDSKNQKIELIRMPISIIGKNPFSISAKDFTVSINDPDLDLEIIKNIEDYNFNCEYVNPFTSKKEIVLINSSLDIILVSNPELKNGNFSFELFCKDSKDSFVMPIVFSVEKVDKIFSLNESEVTIISEKDFSIVVTNTNLDKQTIKLDVDGLLVGVIEPAETYKVLAKDETREIFFKVLNPDFLSALGNETNGNLIVIGENGFVEKIPVKVNFAVEEEKSYMMWYIIGGVAFFFILILLIRRYRQLNSEEEVVNNNSNDELFLDDDFL